MNLHELKEMSMTEIVEGISYATPGSTIEKVLQSELTARHINAMLNLTETISNLDKNIKELLKSAKNPTSD